MVRISTMAGFRARIIGAADYDIADSAALLRKDQRPVLDQMIQRVVDGLQISGRIDRSREEILPVMMPERRRADAEALRDAVKRRVGAD